MRALMEAQKPRRLNEPQVLLALLRGLCALAIVGAAIARAPVTIGSDESAAKPPKPVFEFEDLEGRRIRPFDAPSAKAVALVFLLPDCPIANSFIPEINRLHESFAPRGVTLVLVHADSETTAEKAREHAREYQIKPPVLLDPHHQWVQRAGATTSPEAVVFSPKGEIVYRGRINDQYLDLGKRRANVTSHDLKNALEAMLAGQPVAIPRHEAVGCPIPPLPTGN